MCKEWISVKDELPKVIIDEDGSTNCILVYQPNLADNLVPYACWNTEYTLNNIKWITHWKPLSPPEEKTLLGLPIVKVDSGVEWTKIKFGEFGDLGKVVFRDKFLKNLEEEMSNVDFCFACGCHLSSGHDEDCPFEYLAE